MGRGRGAVRLSVYSAPVPSVALRAAGVPRTALSGARLSMGENGDPVLKFASAGRSPWVGLVGEIFFSFFAFRIVLFCIFVVDNQCFVMHGSPYSSASALLRCFGWSDVFGWFALCVQRVAISPGIRPAERVAAACPRFASWLCGRFGCSWFVGWSVACACAASLGVFVGSGGVPVGGRQSSLFL